jgi:hypothetical protein
MQTECKKLTLRQTIFCRKPLPWWIALRFPWSRFRNYLELNATYRPLEYLHQLSLVQSIDDDIVFEQTIEFFWQQCAPMTSLNKEAGDFRQSTGEEVAFLEDW